MTDGFDINFSVKRSTCFTQWWKENWRWPREKKGNNARNRVVFRLLYFILHTFFCCCGGFCLVFFCLLRWHAIRRPYHSSPLKLIYMGYKRSPVPPLSLSKRDANRAENYCSIALCVGLWTKHQLNPISERARSTKSTKGIAKGQ